MATIAKRRRALGPKNASDFMRQTIRDREKTRQENSVKANLQASLIPLHAEAAVRLRRRNQPPRGASSEIPLIVPLGENTHSCHSNRSAPEWTGTSHSGLAGRAENDGQERSTTSTYKVWCTSAFTRDYMPRLCSARHMLYPFSCSPTF